MTPQHSGSGRGLSGEHGSQEAGRPPSLSVLSPSAESASNAVPLQRSQSLPHSATVTLGGSSDPSALSSSALSEREASRLDKFKQLLAGPNTDLGKCPVEEDCAVVLCLSLGHPGKTPAVH